jgi:hypothetical protein
MALQTRLDFAVAGTAFVVTRSERFVVSDERRVGEAVLDEHELNQFNQEQTPRSSERCADGSQLPAETVQVFGVDYAFVTRTANLQPIDTRRVR